MSTTHVLPIRALGDASKTALRVTVIVLHVDRPSSLVGCSRRNKRNQAEAVGFFLKLTWHHPDIDHYAVDRDKPDQGVVRELAGEPPTRIQWNDVEDPPDLVRLGRTGALSHAKQCAQLAAVQMGRL